MCPYGRVGSTPILGTLIAFITVRYLCVVFFYFYNTGITIRVESISILDKIYKVEILKKPIKMTILFNNCYWFFLLKSVLL